MCSNLPATCAATKELEANVESSFDSIRDVYIMDNFILCNSAKVIEQNEAKLSKIKDDLVNTKEQLNQTVLAKEVLDQEKREVGKSL